MAMTKEGGWLAWVVRCAVRLGRWSPWVALGLCLPALAGGLALDDLYLSNATGDFGQFVQSAFTVVGDGQRPAHFATEDLPWWSAQGVQLDFFRPVAAATHAIDRLLWPGQPWLMHAHSIAWFVLLTWLVRRAYRTLDDDATRADLASFVFAVSQAHAMNVGWIAARNSLVGTVFVVVALLLHDHARTARRGSMLVLSTVAFGVALLGNEGAVAGLGLLLAYALVVDRGPRRLTSLLPYLAVVVAWRVLYRALGYGAVASGMYLDPASDPVGYAMQTLQHAVIDLAGLLGLGVLDPFASVPGGLAVAFGGATLVVVTLLWLARTRLTEDDPHLRWSVAAMLLCLGTAGTTMPTDRGLLLPSLAASVVIADLIVTFRRPDAGRLRRLVGGLLVASHLMLSPLLLPVRVQATGWLEAIVERSHDRLPAEDRAQRHAVLLSAPSDLAMLYDRAIARHRDEPFFASLQWIYAGPGALTLSRPDQDTLVLASTLPWLAAPLDRGFRGDVDYQVGDRVRRPCFDVTIEAVEAGHPTSIRLAPEPDCEVLWLAWLDGGPAPLELPAVGEQRELPPATF